MEQHVWTFGSLLGKTHVAVGWVTFPALAPEVSYAQTGAGMVEQYRAAASGVLVYQWSFVVFI